MLLRDILSKDVILVLILILSTLAYSGYQKIKYSNCETNNFQFLGIEDDSFINVTYTTKKVKRFNMKIKLKKIKFPSENSKDLKDKDLRENLRNKISDLIQNSKNVVLFLKDCRRKTKKTDGTIYIDSKKIEEILIEQNYAKKEKSVFG